MQLSRRDWRWWLVVVWTVSVLSADLKVVMHPRVHWIVSLLTIAPLALMKFRDLDRKRVRFVVPVLVFCTAIMVTATQSGQALYDLSQALKIAFIFAFSVPVLSTSRYSEAALAGIKIAVATNFILLVLGLLGLTEAARQMAAMRWGTILNMPGSLSRLGILMLAYASYSLFQGSRLDWKKLILLASSIFVVTMDGSRTAILGLGLGTAFVLMILVWEHRSRVAWRVLSLAIPLILISVLISPSQARVRELARATVLAVDSAGTVVSEVPSAGEAPNSTDVVDANDLPVVEPGSVEIELAEPMQRIDNTRLAMVRTAWSAIKEHPIMGTGMGTTVQMTPIGPMVVHMAYLQVWADVGLLGFIGYCWIVFGWLTLLPRVFRSISDMEYAEVKARAVGAVFMLLYHAWVGLFHPVSSEWSEWVTYIIPLGVLLSIAASTDNTCNIELEREVTTS